MKQILLFKIFLNLLFLTPYLLKAQVRFNEYSTSNWGGQFKDNYNEDEDWFELYNNSASSVDLSGYYLSDDNTDPAKWQIPSGTQIPANGFLIFWCSGRNEVSGGNYHTNFRLTQTKDDGEELVLSFPSTAPADVVPLELTQKKHSRALETDGATSWKVCTQPSPGATNNGTSQFNGYSATPAMDVQAGFYSGPITVALSTTEPNATIRFTLNGEEPKSNSPIYSNPSHPT